ncbi:uncharacterized protein N7483_008709 [Penicillium malachiteum]|uniref:uncharacterized protein n=1 Tax=Penicillium malachiteum TaxID=1324776 RepID=UPI002546FB41|nr:uncharacterized protein N7483_008709 [Penicillium malachiteum]KAJ5720775.1 hypothetical protein N7483_008709 [Penicillium malachiteum]
MKLHSLYIISFGSLPEEIFLSASWSRVTGSDGTIGPELWSNGLSFAPLYKDFYALIDERLARKFVFTIRSKTNKELNRKGCDLSYRPIVLSEPVTRDQDAMHHRARDFEGTMYTVIGNERDPSHRCRDRMVMEHSHWCLLMGLPDCWLAPLGSIEGYTPLVCAVNNKKTPASNLKIGKNNLAKIVPGQLYADIPDPKPGPRSLIFVPAPPPKAKKRGSSLISSSPGLLSPKMES